MPLGKILFRCDADVAIGTGHVMRCLALAQAWQEAGGHAVFVMAKIPEALLPRLTSQGFDAIVAPGTSGTSEDVRVTKARAIDMGAEWIVVDGDQFSSGFVTELKSGGYRIALLDDFGKREAYDVDLVVNPNLEADAALYRRAGCHGTALAGIRYVLLRREFRSDPDRSFPPIGNRVLVTLGGSDPENLAPRVVEALASLSDLKITIVAGAGYRDRLPMLVAPHIAVKFNVSDMPAEMRCADMAIIVAGGTLWELLRMRCVVLSYARNTLQEKDLAKLDAEKVLVNMGRVESFRAEALVITVRRVANSVELRRQMGDSGKQLMDGRGAERIVQAMIAQANG